ncbi:hypothetical protein SAMN02745108_00763 [Fibrobacter intestinalis]|uniref:Uncharacterized protein n=1 Tax=Fibrobacter intestinalis TaxID=28122 RepID=A0A1T4L4A2_9BACT|nr:hypothetical protein BGW94_0750 [Fibrobacter sp. NR9]SJZ49545.1 hypothetical protein SAMN02745108_00763 [Fibrobacter intestinalis]
MESVPHSGENKTTEKHSHSPPTLVSFNELQNSVKKSMFHLTKTVIASEKPLFI